MNKKLFKFDFDIINGTYIYYWVKNYVESTLKLVTNLNLKIKGKKLLDFGVGRSRAFSIYKAWGINEVMGIDIRQKEIEYVLKKSQKLGINLQVLIDTPTNEGLKKIPSNSYEIAVIMNILQLFPLYYKKEILEEIVRILKSNGILIVVEVPKFSLIWFFSKLTNKKLYFLSFNEFISLINSLRFRLVLIENEESNFFMVQIRFLILCLKLLE